MGLKEICPAGLQVMCRYAWKKPLGTLWLSGAHGVGNPRVLVSGSSPSLLKFQSLKSKAFG